MSGGISRRRLLGWRGGCRGGRCRCGVGLRARPARRPGRVAGADAVPFRGTHQAGIVTPAQDRLHFVALDLTSTGKATVQRDAEPVDHGRRADDAGASRPRRTAPCRCNPEAPPADTGEALDLPPSSLTVTIGFGPHVLRQARHSPTGARPRWPTCPASPATSSTRPARAATSASRPARTTRRSRCTPCATSSGSASGRRRCAGRSSASAGRRRRRPQQATPRNLFGFKDGTNNLKAEEPDLLDEHVWVRQRRRAGLDGRRHLPRRPPHPDAHRDLGPLLAQRAGADHRARPRARAPRWAGPEEFEPANFRSIDANGTPVIPLDAHVRLASAESLNGIRILRRGLQLRRRQRRPRAPQRRPVLHLLRPQPADAVRADAAGAGAPTTR